MKSLVNKKSSTSEKKQSENSPKKQQTSPIADADRAQILSVRSSSFIKKKNSKLHEDYQKIQKVGDGNFGEVILAKDQISKQQRIVQEIRLSLISKNFDQKLIFQKELVILQKLDHPHIMKVYEFYETRRSFYMVSELCRGTQLYKLLCPDEEIETPSKNDSKKNKSQKVMVFSEAESASIIEQTLSALSYAHQHNVIHRDIKPQNLIVDVSDRKNIQVKVIDWGEGVFYDGKSNEKLSELVGSIYYLAPEVIIGNYDEKADLWSTGIMMYFLLTGDVPFDGNQNNEIMDSIKNSQNLKFDQKKIFSKISEEAKDLLKRLLKYDPVKRASAKEAIAHPWFQLSQQKLNSDEEDDVELIKEKLENLKQFQPKSNLQKAVFSYMANYMITEKDQDQLTQMFKQIDKNNDGQLSLEEFIIGFNQVYDDDFQEQEVLQLFYKIDTDKSGFISYSEFITAMANKEQFNSQTQIQKAFSLFDRNGDGEIQAKQLKQVLQLSQIPTSTQSWDFIIGEVDQDNDGQINLDEFTAFLFQGVHKISDTKQEEASSLDPPL